MSKNFKSPPNCLGSIFKSIFFVSLFCLPLFIIFFLTKNRVIDLPSNQILPAQKAKLVDTDPPISFVANHPKSEQDFNQPDNRKPVETNPPNDVLCEVSDYKDLSQDLVFNEFKEWIKEYEAANCLSPTDCLDHDPRYLRGLLLRGERLSRTRAIRMAEIIRGDPKKALELAISEKVAEALPPVIAENLEKWESALVDVKAWHSCSSQIHKNCLIEKKAIFPDGRSMDLYSFGRRKDLKTLSGISAWGVSLDGKFAMSENGVRRIDRESATGMIQFAGNQLSYTSHAQVNYFEELVIGAEYHGRRIGRKITYPIAMGSDGSLHNYLREKYELFPVASEFGDIPINHFEDETYPEMARAGNAGMFEGRHYAGYTERPGRKILQIESQAENDYVVELLKDYFGKSTTATDFVWLGASNEPSQVGQAYDRRNQKVRSILLGDWGASSTNWFWLDGRELNYTNWNASPGSFSHLALDWRNTGTWFTKDGGAGGDSFGYVLEKNLPFEIGSIPTAPSGTRKVLVVPARFEDQTTKMRSATDSYSNWRLERNHLQTNEFGELINEDVYSEPFEPIARGELETLMQEVKEFYLRNTDQDLNLVPVIAPTVTIPFRVRSFLIPGSGEHEGDTDGNLTGFTRLDYEKGNPVLDFAENAMIQAGQESEEWDFYGPAFVGIADIKLNTPIIGNYSPDSLPLLKLEGGAFTNPATLLPHVRFQPAALEPILDENGSVVSIRVLDTGAYYFDPKFGSHWDSGGRSIFGYNYIVDDNQPVEDSRSALYEFRDLCQKLDIDGDGTADYSKSSGIVPELYVNGVLLPDANYTVEVNNVCLSWIGFTNYEHFEPVSDGLAWYGAPGAHVVVREGSASSATIAHELGHNFGLLHAQRYASKGEQALSDEGTKIAYGNPYSVMGSAPSIKNGLGGLTLAEKLFLYDNFDGQAGYTPGRFKGCDVLDLNNAADLAITDLNESDPSGIPNKFRIYQSNSPTPPLALRESNFTLHLPIEVKQMLDEHFGDANYSNSPPEPSSAHDYNKTASDLNKTVKLKVVGTGEDAEATIFFQKGIDPTLIISSGGRGFINEPTFKILDEDNKTELLTIDASWIREFSPKDHIAARLFDHNSSNRWIRGVRISANPSINSVTGLDVSDPLRRYYLSYRSDISSTGLVLLSSNNPDLNNSYTRDREYFYTQSEAFLLDATPQTPNDYKDAPLLVGSTYSDHDSDIHITPTAYGGTKDFGSMKITIDEKRELVLRLEAISQQLRETVSSFDQSLINAQAQLQDYQTQLELLEFQIAEYERLELTNTELYEEAQEQQAYLNALLVLAQENVSGLSTQLEGNFKLLEDNQFSLDKENRELNSLAEAYRIEQDRQFPYLEIVVNIGTLNTAVAPDFELHATSQTPAIGETVTMRAMVADGNTSAYAYSWFLNEKPLNHPDQLNRPVISPKFSQAGHYVIRSVVSDMKGGVSSRNLIISVSGAEKTNKAFVSGTVRSTEGFLQGARVVIEEAPIIEHQLSMGGTLRDSFFPSGESTPAAFMVDGEYAPQLTFRRGEIHRFYLDKSLNDYNISFLEKPENNPPRIDIHMLTDPRIEVNGKAYFRNPDINYTTRSAFSSYLSRKTGTYLEMLQYLKDRNNTGLDLNETNGTASNNAQYLDLLEYLSSAGINRFDDFSSERQEIQVMNPYPKVLLEETNVTKGLVGPVYANELGFITYGGRGYDRNDTPRVDVRRSSIWEDYFGNTNATAVGYVDGVGTISPVNAIIPNTNPKQAEFLGSSWALRSEKESRDITLPDSLDNPSLVPGVGAKTNLPPVPDLVVWGSGGGDADDSLSEVNASVTAWTDRSGHNLRSIYIYNQGKGFEPNATMAVLHYPRDPFAYWTFDRHESLFEDNTQARHQPSPAWNRELAGLGDRLIHYWKLDDDVNNSTTSLVNEINSTAILNIRTGAGSPSSTWGLLGKTVALDGTRDLNASGVIPDGNFTLSLWVNLNPNTDLNISIGGVLLSYSDTTKVVELGGAGGPTLTRGDTFNDWMHLAVTYDGNMSFYQDGRRNSGVFFPTPGDLEIVGLDGAIDEVKIYNFSLPEAKVRYLSGRNYLDLSGNKYHATPGDGDFIAISPEVTADVPQSFSYPNTPVIELQMMNLGDSYPSEDHGRSLAFNGGGDHLDLSSHLLDFGLPEGTICMWLKTTTSNLAPLLWMSSPLEVTIIEIEEQNSSETIITPGSFFAFELLNGMPRLAGVTAFSQTSKVNDGQWHHVAASFPAGKIWVDGNPVSTSSYDTQNILFEGADTTLEFIGDANKFYIGKAPDRTDPNVVSTFNGKLDDVIFYDRTLTNDEVYYLYELRRGREQVPRLEAVVDAIGTIDITAGGSGYRENPDLVFWYGANNETKTDLSLQKTNFTDLNTTPPHGTLAYVTSEDIVYYLHKGRESFRSYNDINWRLGNVEGWRIHSAAAGIGEFGDSASLDPVVSDVVWTKKLDRVIEIPLPDGRWDKRYFVDYVTMDSALASSSVVNNTNPHSYFKPNGLGGFAETPLFSIASPEVYNPDALSAYTAKAYALYFVDHDENDSLTIVDGGSGFDVPGTAAGVDLISTTGEPFSILQFMVSGKGFKPSERVPYSDTYSGTSNYFTVKKEDWNSSYPSANLPSIQEGNPNFSSNDPNAVFSGGKWYHSVPDIFGNTQTVVIDANNPNRPYLISELTIEPGETEVNKTVGSVSVDYPGYGYAMPIELKVVGGRPMWDERVGQLPAEIGDYENELGLNSVRVTAYKDGSGKRIPRGSYIYGEAEFNVTKIDANGSILEVVITKPGKGYIPYNILPKTDPYALTSFTATEFDLDVKRDKWYAAPNPPFDFHLNEYPFVSVTGGGGYGAKIIINNIDKISGEIRGINIVDGGRGYFNIDPQNKPSVAFITPVSSPQEEEANLSVRLGGSLKEIPPCTGCSSSIHTEAPTTYSHLEPWIEIWDRGRKESEIDSMDSARTKDFPRVRAHAVPKVVDGKIKKVVVINSGSGYIDPVAIVRDAPPKHNTYHTTGDNYDGRTWRCTFKRVNINGQEEECGHIQSSLYPPDECPGETDDELPYADENGTVIVATGNEISGWISRHSNTCINHADNPDHSSVRFVSRKCWGTKLSYVLQNPVYRIDDPGNDQFWGPLDANLSVVSKDGRILRIEVMNEGQDYFGSKLVVEGSGSGVDAIPVFNEFGVNTHVIFDDPRLFNDELDNLPYRTGAGQGFRERPWAWDDGNESAFGGREKVKVYAWHSQVITSDGGLSHAAWNWNFGEPVLMDNLGDRVVAIDINDPGLYASDGDSDGQADLNLSTIQIDYNTTVELFDPSIPGFPSLGTIDFNNTDHDGNGYTDFVQAKATAHATYTITRTLLNHDSVINASAINRPELGLFTENPVLEFYDERNLNGWEYGTDYVTETPSNYIRLNRKVAYDPEKELSYIELYVDERFPNQLYYGLDLTEGDDSRVLPRFGNLITVTEGLPGMNWAIDETGVKKKFSYTDSNGFYALSDIDPGFYNVAVFMEDQKFQESTFRPDSNISRVSEILYLAGFPELILETDQAGSGRSTLVWSPEARRLSRPVEDMNYKSEYDYEYRVLKKLEGIGRGFNPNAPPPELTIVPYPENIGRTPPNIDVNVSVDGSLMLRIIDDENTSRYSPQDRFMVFHNTQVSNLDFVESHLYTESNQTFSFGSKADATPGSGKLNILPNDGNGLNPLAVPVSTFEREWNASTLTWDYVFRDRPFQLRAIAYDENGSSVSTASVQWSAILDFNSSEGNNSRVIQLEDENFTRGLDVNGSSINVYLYSLLRKGFVSDLEIIEKGQNYTAGSLIGLVGGGTGFVAHITQIGPNGEINQIEILNNGQNYSHSSTPNVKDIKGSGAILRPVLPYSGTVKIEANITLPGAASITKEYLVLKPSLKYPLDALESWRNKYTDNFWVDAKDPTWIATYLSYNGGLPNGFYGDNDDLTNQQEWELGTNPLKDDTDGDLLSDKQEDGNRTNPFLPDTDADGLSDFDEIIGPNPSNPRMFDSDKDGISDLYDLNSSRPDGHGIISGLVRKKPIYASNLSVYFDCEIASPTLPSTWDSNWTKTINNFYLDGKTEGNYTVRAFIDLDDNQNYDFGEPYAEENITLTVQSPDSMGTYLQPADPPPTLTFRDNLGLADPGVNAPNLLERNVTIDVNDTNSINSFAFAVEATDPVYPSTFTDVNVTFTLGEKVDQIEFLVDGNFTRYLDLSQNDNSSAFFDLKNTPVGNYQLRYRAVDEYGNISNEVFQNIEIKDTQPPYITILDIENSIGVSTFSATEIKTVIPNLNFDLNETNNSVVWQWPYGESLSLKDLSLAQSNKGALIIHVMDTKNEVLTDWNFTYGYNDRNFTADSNAQDIEDQNLSYQDLTNEYLVNDGISTTRAGTHKLEFNATDRSGNHLDFTLYLLIKPTYSSTITAIDGYLENALVGFDADGDGISDLDREFRTNSFGRAEIFFTDAEFNKFDTNVNGHLDPEEGKFVVLGGVDTSTGVVFSGKLYADANATVVSPLTTLISQLMQSGLSKELAVSQVSTSLGLSPDIDLSSYDPIQKAFEGDENATHIMMANLRMANLINQSEGLLQALSPEYVGYEVGTDLLNQIANWIRSQNSTEILDLEHALVDAIPVALASVGIAGELSIEDQLAMFQLMTEFDHSFRTTEDHLEFGELMSRQTTFIQELEELIEGLSEQMPLPKYCSLELNATEGGNVQGSGNYQYGSKASIVAIPDSHSRFVKWEGLGLQNPDTENTNVFMTMDRNITAVFEPILYELMVDAGIGGRVEGAGEFSYGKKVTLHAIPEDGFTFLKWTGQNLKEVTEKSITLEINGTQMLYAHFEQAEMLLLLETSEGGEVYGSGNYQAGDIVSITATPKEGYVFSKWIGEGAKNPLLAGTTVNFTGSMSLTAEFKPAQPGIKFLTIKSYPSIGGHGNGSGEYTAGSQVPLVAIPNSGYEFDHWATEDGVKYSTDPEILYLLENNSIVIAYFKPELSALATEKSLHGDVTGTGFYSLGEHAEIGATPDLGYHFVRWIGKNIADPFSPQTTVLMAEPSAISAVFEPIQVKLTVTSNYGGFVTGGGVYNFGEKVELKANPATGYKFTEWEGSGLEEDVTSESIFVEMNTSRSISAKFELINNFFTPQGQDFYHLLTSGDLSIGHQIKTLEATDEDGSVVTFHLIEGNPDSDSDSEGMFELSPHGNLRIYDADEIALAAGTRISLLVSISDGGGKSGQLKGIIEIANQLTLRSSPLGNSWYHSSWLGNFFSGGESWIYHLFLGWMYVHPAQQDSYWLWNHKMGNWLWTNENLYPQVYTGSGSKWLYFNFHAENVRVFDYDLQSWDILR